MYPRLRVYYPLPQELKYWIFMVVVVLLVGNYESWCRILLDRFDIPSGGHLSLAPHLVSENFLIPLQLSVGNVSVIMKSYIECVGREEYKYVKLMDSKPKVILPVPFILNIPTRGDFMVRFSRLTQTILWHSTRNDGVADQIWHRIP